MLRIILLLIVFLLLVKSFVYMIDIKIFLSACSSPYLSCQPSPIILPSFTITAPTIGFGDVYPMPRFASSIALLIYCSSVIWFPFLSFFIFHNIHLEFASYEASPQFTLLQFSIYVVSSNVRISPCMQACRYICSILPLCSLKKP